MSEPTTQAGKEQHYLAWCDEPDCLDAIGGKGGHSSVGPEDCSDCAIIATIEREAAAAAYPDLARKAAAVGDITIERNRLRKALADLMDHAVEVNVLNDAVVYAMQFADMDAARALLAAASPEDEK